MAEEAGIEDDIVTTGVVSDDELCVLYNRATMLVHPSRYEGFGLPIAEAMACGAYLIARRLPSTTAYIGEAGDAYDNEAEAEMLLRATLDWSEDRWRSAALRSIDRAFRLYVDRVALKPILNCWQHLGPARAGPLS